MSKNLKLTPKQYDFIMKPLKRWNILSGATGGGKTFGANLRFIQQLRKDILVNNASNYLLTGRTLTTLERNVLMDLKKSSQFFQYNKSSKIAFFGKVKIYLEGVNDRQAGEKIRGLNLKGAYCDEVVTYPKDFMDMLKSRLREPNAWCIATCNPDHPKHWFNIEYRQNSELEKNLWDFVIDDNKFLPKEFVKQIKKEYTGVLYQRYILGNWVNAEGCIYKLNNYNIIDNNSIPFGKIEFVSVGIDIGGNKSKTTFVTTAIGKNYSNVIVLNSIKLDGEQTTERIIEEFKNIVKENKEKYGNKFKFVFVDSEAQVFINSFRKLNLNVSILNSKKNRILDRIHKTNQMIGNGKLKIAESCKTLLEALENATWNEKAKVDERLDDGTSDIDTLDAFEYSWENWIKLL